MCWTYGAQIETRRRVEVENLGRVGMGRENNLWGGKQQKF